VHHDTQLIATLAVGFSAALLVGLVVKQLRIPTIVGYLMAGMIVGPFTPGFVADRELAPQLAELGVILLMFGVGLHFSVSDLLRVKNIAIPGAVVQITIATLLGVAAASFWGWSFGGGLVFGLGLSVASTVVLLRALLDIGDLGQIASKVAVGWLIVEDIVTVIALVLLPVLAGTLGGTPSHESGGRVFETLAISLGKVALFLLVMLVVGRRLLPRIFQSVVGVDSRELFILAVLASALGVSYGASRFFDVSFALGAFVAGLVLSETTFGHRAEAEIFPIREAFAVLFFVSVGMLIDPRFLVENPLRILTVTAIVVVGKGMAALGICLLLRQPIRTGVTVALGLAQIGEFSFILASMGMSLGLLPREGNDLILAGALITITLNPILFRYIDTFERAVRKVVLGRRHRRLPVVRESLTQVHPAERISQPE
jgi:CPA2 family monovalent cation:H+ antiporter-2